MILTNENKVIEFVNVCPSRDDANVCSCTDLIYLISSKSIVLVCLLCGQNEIFVSLSSYSLFHCVLSCDHLWPVCSEVHCSSDAF